MTNNKSYKEKMDIEIKHYKTIFKNRLFQKVPNIWNECQKEFSSRIRSKAKCTDFVNYITKQTKNKKRIKVLGLGSGACGIELTHLTPELKKNNTKLELVCLDINKEALKQAKKEAKKRKINFKYLIEDVNKVSLKEKEYDVVIAHAALHHFLKLNKICKQVNKSLKKDGFLITVDIPTKNGYLMWPKTYCLINFIWLFLPFKFKTDHTLHKNPSFAFYYKNIDYSKNSFECINSEAILPSLRKHLKEKIYIPAFSISRRFFDTKFGPNFNVNKKIDRLIFKIITKIDWFCLDKNILKPETFFGIYSKK